MRVVDGSHLPGTEHRLGVLRRTRAAGLPGRAVAAYDPAVGLVTDIIPCEGAHAQERALTPQVLALVRPGDVWVGGRNFRTTRPVFGVAAAGGHVVVRRHGSGLSARTQAPPAGRGRCPTGEVSEGSLTPAEEGGAELAVRRVSVRLDEPTREGTPRSTS